MRMHNLEWRSFNLDGHPVFYRASIASNHGNPETLIHLHGVGMSGTYMVPAADVLAAEYRSFVPDLPGFGRSAKTGTPPTIEGLAGSTRDFMDALGIDKATLIGNSMGCMTILEFAHRYPERVDRAVLCSPGRPVYQPLARGMWQLFRMTIVEPIGMLPILLHDYMRCGVRDGMSLYRSMVGYPANRRFLQLRAPALVIRGSRDPLVSEAELLRYRASGGSIQTATIPEAGHTMNYSHPRETAAAIADWLAVRPRSAACPGLAGSSSPTQ